MKKLSQLLEYGVRVCALTVVGACALGAQAAEIAWIGADGADWSDASNWQGGAVPGFGDTAVFNPGSGSSLSITNTATTSYPMPNITVKSGTVIVKRSATTNNYALDTAERTYVFDVAEGAELYLRPTISTGKEIATFEKRGAGTMYGIEYNKGNWGYNRNSYLKELHVVEGLLKFTGFGQRWDHATVESGATLTFSSISSFQGFERIEAKSGATVNFTAGNANTYFAGLTGEGTFSNSTQDRSFTLWNGPYQFDGIFQLPYNTLYLCNSSADYHATTDEEKHLILGNANGFKDVKYLAMNATLDFAPGISDFYLGNIKGYEGYPLTLANTNSESVTVHCTYDAATPFVAEGAGDIVFTGAQTVYSNQLQHTGMVYAEANLTLGNGTDSAYDADLSTITGIEMTGGTLFFNNAADATIATPITGAGAVTTLATSGTKTTTLLDLQATGKLTVNSPTIVSNLHMKANCYCDVNSRGVFTGDVRYNCATPSAGTEVVFAGPETRVFNQLGREVSGTYYSDYLDKIHTLDMPSSGLQSITSGSLEITDGARFFTFMSDAMTLPTATTVSDGGRICCIRDDGLKCASTGDSGTLVLDGGELAYSGGGNPFFHTTYASCWTIAVGAKGGRICQNGLHGYHLDYGLETKLNVPVTSGVAVGKDGGFTFALAGRHIVDRPVSVTGGVTFEDGYVIPSETSCSESANAPFGTGDISFDGGRLMTPSDDSEKTLYLASGAGAKFRMKRGGTIGLWRQTNKSETKTARTAPLTVEIGPGGATESPIVRSAGGVLMLETVTGDLLDGSIAAVKVNGGVSTYSDGVVKLPIFASTNEHMATFLKYDATKGFTALVDSDFTEGLEGGADSVARVILSGGTTATVNSDTQVRQLLLERTSNGDNIPFVKINSGASLRVGNGTDPAMILASGHRNDRGCVMFSGDGTLDFGTSEGVFALGPRYGYWGQYPEINCKIAGSAGVTFYMPMQCNQKHQYTLGESNLYSGGTWIDNCAVIVKKSGGLGSGTVDLSGGYSGGASVYVESGVTLANDFRIKGPGQKLDTEGGYTVDSLGAGAIRFTGTGAKLTGDIEIDGCSRITSWRNTSGEVSGEISGVISGGRLEILYTKDAPVAFSGKSVYTGGTEMCQAKAVLRGANPQLGTGSIWVDDSTLRFENTAALTVSNRVWGVGTVELAGAEPVTFAGHTRSFTAGIALAGQTVALGEIPAWATNIVNTTGGNITLKIPANRGKIALGEVPLENFNTVNLDIGAGTTLDLSGREVTVRRLVGVGETTNGTLTEVKPRRGVMVIIE